MELVSTEWYHYLVSDCKQIIEDAKNNAGMVLIEAKYELGKRILTDYERFGSYTGGKTQQDLADELDFSQKTISDCIRFAERIKLEYDDSFESFSNTVTKASWRKIALEWLPKRRRKPKELLSLCEGLAPIKLYQGDIMTVYEEIPSESIDFIITDPPYGQKYLELYEKLGRVAQRLLRRGGSLIAMSGQSYIPSIVACLGKYLDYNWIVAYLTPGGQSAQLWQRKVNTFWKPLLWYTKGKYEEKWIGDVTKSAPNDNDKRFMEWQQSETGMADIIERFTEPEDIILDPFMGSGTTGWAALSLKRKFIGVEIDPDIFEVAYKRLCGDNS